MSRYLFVYCIMSYYKKLYCFENKSDVYIKKIFCR